MIYIAVLCNSRITAEPLYNTPFFIGPYAAANNTALLAWRPSQGTKLYCLVERRIRCGPPLKLNWCILAILVVSWQNFVTTCQIRDLLVQNYENMPQDREETWFGFDLDAACIVLRRTLSGLIKPEISPFVTPTATRKLCYRKDYRAMRAI